MLRSEKHYRWRLVVSKLYPALLIMGIAALSLYPDVGDRAACLLKLLTLHLILVVLCRLRVQFTRYYAPYVVIELEYLQHLPRKWLAV